MTSIIPFFILLLATFSYSVPIGQTSEYSTVNYDYTTNQPIVNQSASVSIYLSSNNQTTNASTIYHDQSSEGSNSNEVTTWGVTRSPRSSTNDTDSSEAEDLSEGSYEESSTQINEKRTYNESPSPSESESSEKRSDKGSPLSSESESNEKRSDRGSSLSSNENTEKRGFIKSSFTTSTQINQKRSVEESPSSSESESSEKRSSEQSSYPSSSNIKKKNPLFRSPSPTIGKKPNSFGHNSSYAKPVHGTGSYPTSTGTNIKRSVEDFLYTTLESSTQFNQRAIRPVTSEEEVESSTAFYSQNQMEVTTNVEPLSSIETFGKYTGLFNNEQSSTSEYETTEVPTSTSQLTETVAIIPGKITETRIYGNSPNKYIQPIQQEQQEQLSQGSTLLLFLLAALLFSAFLVASTIAIFKINKSLKRRIRITEMEADLEKHLLR